MPSFEKPPVPEQRDQKHDRMQLLYEVDEHERQLLKNLEALAFPERAITREDVEGSEVEPVPLIHEADGTDELVQYASEQKQKMNELLRAGGWSPETIAGELRTNVEQLVPLAEELGVSHEEIETWQSAYVALTNDLAAYARLKEAPSEHVLELDQRRAEKERARLEATYPDVDDLERALANKRLELVVLISRQANISQEDYVAFLESL